MKIKIRISFLISVLSIIVFILLLIVYFNCESNSRPTFDVMILDAETRKQIEQVAALKKELWEDAPRHLSRSKSRERASQGAYDGSNRAEEEADDGENEDFLNGVSLSMRLSSGIAASNSFLHAKLVQDCLHNEKMRFQKENRHFFPDLVQLSDDMKTSPLFKSATLLPRITLQQLLSSEYGNNLTTMQRFQNKISNQDLYEENDPDVDALLEKMATMKIKKVVENSKGTQLKLFVTFNDGSQAMLKPMRFDREKETNLNHFHFNDFERHNSEIAAFHLDRILGFRRCPPVVGRKVNIKTELFDNAEKDFKKTFFISPADNICFHGHCKQYCDTSHAICGHPATVEASLASLLLPERKKRRSPWRRSYSKRHPIAEWQKNDSYCQGVRQQDFFNNSKHLADLVDMYLLDFLIGNMDRHSYETFKLFGDDSFILHLDQGRGFGRSKHDELSILAPLTQCCFLHSTTFYRLVDLQHDDAKLSAQMRCSLYRDPLNPVLTDSHLEALDRRLEIILHTIRGCIHKHGMNNVFYH